MKLTTLKIKNYASNVAILDYDLKKRLLLLLFTTLILFAFSYIFILTKMVLNTTERKALVGEIHSLSSEISDLELQYLSLSENIDINLSYTMGFKEIKPNFAVRKSIVRATEKEPSVYTKLVKNEI